MNSFIHNLSYLCKQWMEGLEGCLFWFCKWVEMWGMSGIRYILICSKEVKVRKTLLCEFVHLPTSLQPEFKIKAKKPKKKKGKAGQGPKAQGQAEWPWKWLLRLVGVLVVDPSWWFRPTLLRFITDAGILMVAKPDRRAATRGWKCGVLCDFFLWICGNQHLVILC